VLAKSELPAPKVPQDFQAPPDNQVNLVGRANLEPMESPLPHNQWSLAHPSALRVHRDRQVTRVPKDRQEDQDNPEHPEGARPTLRVPRDHRDLRDLPDLQDSPETQVLQEYSKQAPLLQAHQVPQDRRDLQDPMDNQEVGVDKAHQVLQAHLERVDHQDPPETPGPQETQEDPVWRALVEAATIARPREHNPATNLYHERSSSVAHYQEHSFFFIQKTMVTTSFLYHSVCYSPRFFLFIYYTLISFRFCSSIAK